MRIHKPEKLELIRLTIKGNSQPTEYLNLIDTNHKEVVEFLVKEFSEYSFKSKGFISTIDSRYCLGGENGKSQRVSLYGIKPQEIVKVLTEIIK
jgi:hypothetical protein